MTADDTPESKDGEFSWADWFQANSRTLSIVIGLVAVASVSGWFYVRSGQIKRLNAERALGQATQSLSAGNQALAATDLQKVAVRYVGTPAGTQAALLLAQMHFDRGAFADGQKALEPYRSARSAGASLADVWSLVADGQLGAGQAVEAAASYQKAADATEQPGYRAVLRAKAARALMSAGKDAEARAIWERLAADPDASVVKVEAELRLGELSARPAGKS